MGFNKILGLDTPTAPATVDTPPPTISDTQENDAQADYSQRASRRRGLLSTILSRQNAGSGAGLAATPSGNTTLG